MVTTSENQISQSKTCQDVDSSASATNLSLSSASPCSPSSSTTSSANSALIVTTSNTQNKLQHHPSANPHSNYTHKTQKETQKRNPTAVADFKHFDCGETSSSSCCSTCSCSSCSCSESESEVEGEFSSLTPSFPVLYPFPITQVPLILRQEQGQGQLVIPGTETGSSPSRSSFLKSKKKNKEQYRIRFEIKDEEVEKGKKEDCKIPLRKNQEKRPLTGSPSSSSSASGCLVTRPGEGKGSFRRSKSALASSSSSSSSTTRISGRRSNAGNSFHTKSGDSGLTTSSASSSSVSCPSSSSRSKALCPIISSSTLFNHNKLPKDTVETKHRQTRLPSQLPSFRDKLPISASCSNISATNSRKVDGLLLLPESKSLPSSQSQSLLSKSKPKRTKSLRKLLIKSKSFVFPSSSSSSGKAEITAKNSSFTNRGEQATSSARYHNHQQKIDCKTGDKGKNHSKPSSTNNNVSNVSKWLRKGFHNKRDVSVNQVSYLLSNQVVCKSCGGFTEEITEQPPASESSRDFIPFPRKYATLQSGVEATGIENSRKTKTDQNGYEQRSWLEMNSEDIYSYGRYTQLPSLENFATTTNTIISPPPNKKLDHPANFQSRNTTLLNNGSKSTSNKIHTNQGNKSKSNPLINSNSSGIHTNQKGIDKEQYQGQKSKGVGSDDDDGNSGILLNGSSSSDISQHKFYYQNKYTCTKKKATIITTEKDSNTTKNKDCSGVQQVKVDESYSNQNQDKSVTMTSYRHFNPSGGTTTIGNSSSGHHSMGGERVVEFHLDPQDEYNSFYDCRIPRPKLKFVIPTHSYGVGNRSKTAIKGSFGRKIDIVDASGFTEISLSDNENEGDDTAYGSGSGSGSQSSSKSSNKFRSEHSSEDSTLSEFEREQELSIVNGNSRRLLTFKRSLWAKHSNTASSHRGKCDQQRIIESLKSLPMFRKLSSSFLTKLSEHVNEVSYDCGECIIQQGSRGEGLFILMSGTAKVTFLSSLNGEEIYLRTLHPGDSFGEKSLQGEKVNMINVRTTDETATSLVIDEEGFAQLMTKNGEFRSRFCDKSRQTFVNEYFERIELEDLRLISTLGIGGFGRVELVTLASDQSQSFALKQMKKCQIVTTRQIEHIKSEKNILMETNCDFITKLYKTFKDDKYLYMLMDVQLGGELWTILRDRGHFNDTTTRFYVGCVLEALKYLHNRNIIYRDLKPENLLLDSKGYLKLVDFGFAKRLESSKTWTFCGTPEYVAPEVILNKGHGISADYWSLGVLMYELLTGTPPFVGGDPMRTYKLILKGVDHLEFPETITKHAYNLIRKLCRENPEDRLGFNRGLSEIKRHKWFDGLDWTGLRSRSLTPPIIPCVKGPHDCGNFDEYMAELGPSPPDDLRGWDWDF